MGLQPLGVLIFVVWDVTHLTPWNNVEVPWDGIEIITSHLNKQNQILIRLLFLLPSQLHGQIWQQFECLMIVANQAVTGIR